jgi:hypothetical protein
LVAVAGALAIVALLPDRLSGGPTTTSTAPVTTTTSLIAGLGLDEPTRPDPLRLYPRRPGARYEDVEARDGRPTALALIRVRVVAHTIEPHDALPARSAPAKLRPYRDIALVDGYVPTVTATTGDVLRVVLRQKPAPFAMPMSCVGVEARNGTVVVPYDPPPKPKPARTTTTTTASTTTTATTTTATATTRPRPRVRPRGRAIERTRFFPIGAYRGRIFLTCSSGFPFFGTFRAVWAIDV